MQTKFTYQSYLSINKKKEETQEIREARKNLNKLKGYYKTVPNYNPPTKIFIREGENEEEKIERFKNRHRSRL
jgi:hypothetical protein